MSLPEVLLWQRLRGGNAGSKFRRQHPIGPYVVDFFCREARLAVEIDGEAHDRDCRPARDDARDSFLRENGYRVVHLPAADILRDPDEVAASVAALVAAPLHHASHGPPPRSGEELDDPPRDGEVAARSADGGSSPRGMNPLSGNAR